MPALSGLLLGLLLRPAGAAEHVVTTEAADDRLMSRVADTVGVAPATIGRFSLGDWLSASGARLVGPGRLLSCPGPPMAAASFEAALDEAVGDIDYAESQSALATLKDALARTSCLTEPVSATTLARGPYLQAIAHLQLDEFTVAAEAFQRALVIDPDLAWDEVYPPKGLDLFENARTELGATQRATVHVLAPEGTQAWLDGEILEQPETGERRLGGWHLLQVGATDTRTAWLQLQGGATTTVIWPSQGSLDTEAWATTVEGRATLDAVLVDALGAGETVLIPHQDTLWRTTLGSGQWSEEEMKPGAPAPDTASPTAERGDRVRWVTWSGAGITGVAGGVALVSLIQASSAASEVNDPVDGASQRAAYDSFQTSDQCWVVSRSVALGGIAVLGTGLVLRW